MITVVVGWLPFGRISDFAAESLWVLFLYEEVEMVVIS